MAGADTSPGMTSAVRGRLAMARSQPLSGYLVIVTDAEPDLLVSATEVARTVTVEGLGTERGAV